ncbi:hypothetical protein PHYPSEUDO_012888 [Phytophthora pseudosyringae]|uniref:Transmembrane protein n=1 Tax=Phytophthora pseudosyringae TaxID=221518 RepID=A0A8T1W7S6_9STRA|nr:hypothetical protein PHYPSEUDO_012888 [Phytophthora pseudosyringae]
MIILVLLVELIPLQRPSDGWLANYGIWIRTAIQAGAVALAAADQAKFFLAVLCSVRQLVALFLAVAVTYTGVAILAAKYVAFPIPFMAITMSPAFFPLLIVSFRVVVGDHVFREILAQRAQLYAFIGFLSAQMALLLVYPFYQVLFRAASENVEYELAAILLLPIIKSAMKNLVSLSISHMEDLVPEAVIFTVDFFNAVYLATSMQNATSTFTIATVMAIDVIQTGIALHDLNQRTDTILSRRQQVTGVAFTHKSVLDAAMSVCRSTHTFRQQNRTYITLPSCLPHELSASSRLLLEQLQKAHDNSPATRSLLVSSVSREANTPPSLPAKLKSCCTRLSTSSSVVPSDCIAPKMTPEPPSEVLSETLRLLFTTECLILAEYLEAVMPFLYACFILVMVELPNAQYHSELDGVNEQNVHARVQSIFVYASLELLSMVGLVMLLGHRGGVKVLHQLAFTLETQRSLVQGKLLLWMLMVMGFRVVHFGADFTFQFHITSHSSEGK